MILPLLTERITKTVEIELKKMEIEEKGIRLRLTIVDTPGFNDSLNGEERYLMFRSVLKWPSPETWLHVTIDFPLKCFDLCLITDLK